MSRKEYGERGEVDRRKAYIKMMKFRVEFSAVVTLVLYKQYYCISL